MEEPVILQNQPVSVKPIVQEAWQLIDGLKWPIFWVLCLSLIFKVSNIVLAATYQFSSDFPEVGSLSFFGNIGYSLSSSIKFVLFDIPGFVICWYISALLIILGVHQALGLTTSVKVAAGECLRVMKRLFGLMLLQLAFAWLILFLGTVAHLHGPSLIFLTLRLTVFLVMVYVSISISFFAIPLVAMQHYTTKKAFLTGIQAINHHGIKIFLTYLLMIGLLLLSLLTLGIGFIWTFPMFYVMGGIWFRESFGLTRRHT